MLSAYFQIILLLTRSQNTLNQENGLGHELIKEPTIPNDLKGDCEQMTISLLQANVTLTQGKDGATNYTKDSAILTLNISLEKGQEISNESGRNMEFILSGVEPDHHNDVCTKRENVVLELLPKNDTSVLVNKELNNDDNTSLWRNSIEIIIDLFEDIIPLKRISGNLISPFRVKKENKPINILERNADPAAKNKPNDDVKKSKNCSFNILDNTNKITCEKEENIVCDEINAELKKTKGQRIAEMIFYNDKNTLRKDTPMCLKDRYSNAYKEHIEKNTLLNYADNEDLTDVATLHFQNINRKLENLKSGIRKLFDAGKEESQFIEEMEISERQESNMEDVNVKGLVENLKGIKFVLQVRQQMLNKQLEKSHNKQLGELAENISLLIKKIVLLQNGVEEIGEKVIENNILLPDEETLITGIPSRACTRCTKGVTEKRPTEERECIELRARPGFRIGALSSLCAQCTICIAVAIKFNDTFTSILNSVELKDLPLAYLDLGDDWCEKSFRSHTLQKINGLQNLVLNSEIMNEGIQQEIAEELVEKCCLYRSLIPDLRLYSYWLDNNLDMIKTICRSDYAVDYKSCIPAFDEDGFFRCGFSASSFGQDFS